MYLLLNIYLSRITLLMSYIIMLLLLFTYITLYIGSYGYTLLIYNYILDITTYRCMLYC